ncbi:MAG: ornithine--oxo-acid transaminase [Alicyclobacillaceae bacterium]|jgi:ornithine--oxo-acid transaminase|uniref:ornithine--oxo-acid transaminase n=1 Tax=Alicyclobacillus sp. SP_1 TaxID=2942475 RepID=UPI00215852BD|nr:ornithine--oxo-acid transaminase [Alicyclobacillus sp. SP_1]MCY0888627.1 ornithine--oxo-acid transaminase [Alicyclobacillaceae bacterium]
MSQLQTPSKDIMEVTDRYGAHNYHPLPIVVSKAERIWVEDPEGNRYMDMLSAYSALNPGHRHPRIIAALKEQADRVTLTSRAFHSDNLGQFYEMLSRLTKMEKILPMNTGAEAVETAIKAARRWAYDIKGVPDGMAEIIVCQGNFHGRTVTAISMSSDAEYQRGFGPLTPGFKMIPYGDIDALTEAITPNTAGFLFEPIQGEAGILIPPDGFLKKASDLCRAHNVLMMADEVQTGFGRTGKLFACEWENVQPDIYILGKALGGGVFPISAVAANHDILDVFNPGSHGSTFGGNPLACAVAIASMEVMIDEKLAERSNELGAYFLKGLQQINNRHIVEVRGRGLFIGIQLDHPARPYCEALMERGLLCKETHENVIRFAPPLIIEKAELDDALTRIRAVMQS